MTGHRGAVRRTDPYSSREAATNRAPRWDAMNGKALRVFYEYRSLACLTHYMVSQLADALWGNGALGKSPWKRSGELWTDYDPPLIAPVYYPDGSPVLMSGEFGDPVESFRITAAGVAAYEGMRRE